MKRTAVLVGCAVAMSVSALTGSAARATFKQCPAMGLDTSCQFLIVVDDQGASVQTDGSQGAYEGFKDSLIGVQNDSSKPLASVALAGVGLFAFDGDGQCNNGMGPAPAGCRPPPESAGVSCDPSTVRTNHCSFLPPVGEPPNYTEPGATNYDEEHGQTHVPAPWPNGDLQNGYEGPRTWFSNVSSDAASGMVNFSPALAPGESTYFSLEEPLGPDTTIHIATAARTITSTRLTGDGISGATITVPRGEPVRDTARISVLRGLSTTTGGTVTYALFRDSGCTVLVGARSTVPVVGGSPRPSAPFALPPGTYYARVTYSGDAVNAPSVSPCGAEVLVVARPFDSGLPTADGCLRTGLLVFHLKRPRGVSLTTARLELNGKLMKLVTMGRDIQVRVPPRQAFHISIVVRGASSGTFEDSQRYRTCSR